MSRASWVGVACYLAAGVLCAIALSQAVILAARLPALLAWAVPT